MDISTVLDNRIDAIFDRIDDLADNENFELIDEQLKVLDVSNEPIAIGIAYLTITLSMVDDLKEREDLKRRMEAHMLTILGVEKTRDMLNGL